LYIGDEVTRKPDIGALNIKWIPYAKEKKLNKTTLAVLFEPPKSKNLILHIINEYLVFVKMEHNVSVAATRGALSEYGMTQPGNNSTIISGYKITFVCEGGCSRYLVFMDSKGNEIYKREVKDEYILQLTPEEIGMKKSEIYYWKLSNLKTNKPFKIRLLTEELAQLVIWDLEKLANEKISDPEKKIKQAAYLQFLSDTYPDEIDLYWLSHQILDELKEDAFLKDDDQIVRAKLKKNYLRHLSNNK